VESKAPTDGSTERVNEFGICLGRVLNTKGAVWVSLKSHRNPISRRVIKAIPMGVDWISHLNAEALTEIMMWKVFCLMSTCRAKTPTNLPLQT
jgi:hypothetical protein